MPRNDPSQPAAAAHMAGASVWGFFEVVAGLPDLEHALFRGRYMDDPIESREEACARLGIAPDRYDEVLATTLRRLSTFRVEPSDCATESS